MARITKTEAREITLERKRARNTKRTPHEIHYGNLRRALNGQPPVPVVRRAVGAWS